MPNKMHLIMHVGSLGVAHLSHLVQHAHHLRQLVMRRKKGRQSIRVKVKIVNDDEKKMIAIGPKLNGALLMVGAEAVVLIGPANGIGRTGVKADGVKLVGGDGGSSQSSELHFSHPTTSCQLVVRMFFLFKSTICLI